MSDLIDQFERLLASADQNDLERLKSALLANKNPKSVNSPPVYNDSYFSSHVADYLDFTYKNPTIFHVVDAFKKKLSSQGFHELSEKLSWSDIPPGKYFTTRSDSSLAAFVVGPKWSPKKGVSAIGAHIDALTVMVKPNSTKSSVEGYDLLGVAPYAGTLSPVWWDRDLGIGGRLWVDDGKGGIESVLVDSTPHPVARVSTLAPHFGAAAEGPFNKESQLVPVIGFGGAVSDPTDDEKLSPLYGRHPLKLLRYVARLAGVPVKNILQWDLQLYDVQKGTVGGVDNEFVFAPRVDDRVCSFAAIAGLLEADKAGRLAEDSFSIVALFDNEEIGSGTRQGARGHLLESVVTRVLSSSWSDSFSAGDLQQTFANSVILSADVNHLVNPNFVGEYLENHKPVPNKGVAISLDPNGHMVTDSAGLLLVEKLARENGDELQYFHIRNDARSGGTIGPFLATQTGARVIDLGIPQLSMHSIRAALGSKDIGLGAKFFSGFFASSPRI